MSRHGKVIVAMSGGVDSSVAAALLKQAGYECVGVFMRVGTAGGMAATEIAATPGRRLRHGCCSAADAADARAMAGHLGIPFYALDFERDFESIIDEFVDEYAAGRTPNPCVVCNIRLKFGKLLRYDQSYVLFGIQRHDLPRCRFPLGEMADKAQVRQIAADLGLHVRDKPDSQEICFVPNNDYRTLVRHRRPDTLRPGEVRNQAGEIIGTHDGIAGYTIGQRRGLGIAAGITMYVTGLDATANTVTLGPREELFSPGLLANGVNWLVDPPPVDQAWPAGIRIRYQHTPAAGRIRLQPDGRVAAHFAAPQLAVTPGQAAVFYDDDIVLAGGWISAAGDPEIPEVS
jgi:tRNA-specific 2-thiouridylase